jgi:hypothetical protein
MKLESKTEPMRGNEASMQQDQDGTGSPDCFGYEWQTYADVLAPVRGLGDRSQSSIHLVEIAISAIGIGLEYSRKGRQMPVRMGATLRSRCSDNCSPTSCGSLRDCARSQRQHETLDADAFMRSESECPGKWPDQPNRRRCRQLSAPRGPDCRKARKMRTFMPDRMSSRELRF